MPAAKKNNGLTEKQEAACQEFIKNGGNMSDAYRSAYNVSKMKPDSINRKAFELFENVKITSRINELQEDAKKRNNLEIDDLLQYLKSYIEVNPKDFVNKDGSMKKISELSDKNAKCIDGFEITTNKTGNEILSVKTKIKLKSGLDSIEKIAKHLGMYKEDNSQKNKESNLTKEERALRILELKRKLNIE